MIVETRLARWTPSPRSHLIGAILLISLAGWACSGRGNVAVGGPCRLDESCVTGVCLRESGQGELRQWQGGYCSGNCAGQDRACPSGDCLRLEDGRSYCVSHCTENADCRRDGYVCATAVEACLPDCRLGWSCGSTLSCDAQTGTCELPGVTPGPVGAPCTWNVDCASGVCTPEQGASGPTHWPGGSCTFDCTNAWCPSGSTCVHFESGQAFCSPRCTSSDACRSDYVCSTAAGACLPDCRLGWSCGTSLACNDETGTCDLPPVTPGPIGAPCVWNRECTSELCTPETSTSGPTYWTGGSCTQECTPTVPCPSGSVCIPFEPSGAYCVGACDSTAECRSGYVCALDVRGCLPDCRLGWSCGSSLLCDAMTGLCAPPSAGTPDAGPDAGMSRDARSDESGQRDAMGGDGRGGAGGPGPGGPTWASTGSVP